MLLYTFWDSVHVYSPPAKMIPNPSATIFYETSYC